MKDLLRLCLLVFTLSCNVGVGAAADSRQGYLCSLVRCLASATHTAALSTVESDTPHPAPYLDLPATSQFYIRVNTLKLSKYLSVKCPAFYTALENIQNLTFLRWNLLIEYFYGTEHELSIDPIFKLCIQ